ncbi:MAG: hypothetical protein ACE363_16125 [Alphaproteobacteria bacterium]
MSEVKAAEQAMRFSETSEIIRVLDTAYDAGIRVFMCTTHDRVAQICDHVRENPSRYADFRFYPCMPYAHKYWNIVTEKGIVGGLKQIFPGNVASTLLSGGMAAARRDFTGMMKILVDAEMAMFHDLPVEYVFLQNVVTDLVLGMGVPDVFKAFADHVGETYGSKAGFITMNMPMLLDALERDGIDHPTVCASINKAAFRMCGGKEQVEALLADERCEAIAMQVLAAGALPADEALDYVCNLKGVDSILFGASSEKNILQTRDLIQKYSA